MATKLFLKPRDTLRDSNTLIKNVKVRANRKGQKIKYLKPGVLFWAVHNLS